MASDDKENKAAAEGADDVKADDKPEQSVVLFRYLSDKNPTGGMYPGVPPGDILAHAYETYPKWIQNSIAESPMYKAVEAKKQPDKGSKDGDK